MKVKNTSIYKSVISVTKLRNDFNVAVLKMLYGSIFTALGGPERFHRF